MSIGESVDHKLHLTDRVDARTGQISVDARGCLTQENYPDLLRNLRGAARIAGTARIAGGGMVVLDLSRATHLDPDVLLALRRLEIPRSHISAGTNDLSGADGISITLVEPRELPTCLMHIGADGEVLAELNSVPGDETHAAGCVISRCNGDHTMADGGGLSEFYDGTLDPGTTVIALSDHALEQLTDALYRHLDSPNPSFAAQTWFELATEELQSRRDRQPGPPVADPCGHAPAAREEVSPA
jgi:hypothetical protein